MKKIPLSQGKFALIDDCDYWLVRQFKWSAIKKGNNWYVQTNMYLNKNKWRRTYLHCLLASFPPFELDHQNGNGLDNRRSNLRPATHSQNLANRGKQSNNTSDYKGVYWHKQNSNWCAHIQYKNKTYHLGSFQSKLLAHGAYTKAAKYYFGEFARAA
jgi:hypothetical protein